MVAPGIAVTVGESSKTAPFRSYTKLDPYALRALLHSPDGPVVREMLKRADQVVAEAKRLVGVSKDPPVNIPYRHPRKFPHGYLRDKIVKRLVDRGDHVIVVQVGADVPYALYHHNGWAGGRTIVPRRSPVLVFWWPKTGRVMYLRSVRQGSFRGNPYLTDALKVLR